jgi:hypothetical protein
MGKKIALILIFVSAISAAAHGQANVTFGGGNGSPLTITLLNPVLYNLPNNSTAFPYFVLQNAGSFTSASNPANGSINYQNNGGSAVFLTGITYGQSYGSFQTSDLAMGQIFGSSVSAGQVLLNPGTMTTTSNFLPPAPSNGSYSTIMIDAQNGSALSGPGIAVVPEPATCSLLALGSAVLGMAGLRRRHANGRGPDRLA